MTLWGRADVTYVCVPVESGGCGVSHRRPVINGAPAKDFILNCQGCENFLRADIARSGGNKKVRTVNGDYGLKLHDRYLGLWGATADTIPETPDEELAREHSEQKTITENASTQTEAFGKIADALAGNQELIAKLAELVTGQSAPAVQVTLPVAPVTIDPNTDVRECLDCGTPIIRKSGQKGALAQRCPEHKAAHLAAQRAGYRRTAA